MASEPLVLGFDTSAAHCAAALLRGDEIIAQKTEEMARGQAERLMVLLEEVLSTGGVGWSDLDAIGVGIGPGNFTGTRISVSAARGLALALDIPAVGVSTFHALAFGRQGVTVTAVKGPADKTYVQVVGTMPDGAPTICEPEDCPAFPARAEPALIAFPAADVIQLRHSLPVTAAAFPLPDAIARIAAARRHSVSAPPAPMYLKPADAAPARDTAPVILDDDA